MNKAIFPGSFDPIHNGHVKVINAAASMYDEVILYVANNSSKKHHLTLEQRYKLAIKVIEDLDLKNVIVVKQSENELTPIFAKKQGITTIIRGLKQKADVTPYESNLAEWYLEENPNLVFNYIVIEEALSSTLIRERLEENKSIKDLVPDVILDSVKLQYGI